MHARLGARAPQGRLVDAGEVVCEFDGGQTQVAMLSSRPASSWPPWNLTNKINGLRRLLLTIHLADCKHRCMVHTTSDTKRSRHFGPLVPKQSLARIAAKWPIAIVALGMALTVIWMAALLWFFVAATGYAAIGSNAVG
jgi:hypothetical protein